jgi:L-alanine-DL-glutamate epimerase-like enolase superfamily enzyme
MRAIDIKAETFPTRGVFRISRSAVTAVDLVVVTLREGGRQGRGECRPYARYGETPASVMAAIEKVRLEIERGCDRQELMQLLDAGAARNAVDCALWDLEAKIAGRPVHELAGLARPGPLTTAFTISLDTPAAMARAAAEASACPLLKLKLGGDGDAERMRAVRAARPDARLIADANEAWESHNLQPLIEAAAGARFELVEQPLPAGRDEALATVRHAVPICADESAHALDGIEAVAGRYDAVNIKLDKTGGLTEALTTVKVARAAGLKIMAGCMVATSLAMAPALLIGGLADWVDLDGPLLLERDREDGLRYEGALLHPAGSQLWG